jgi:hypothetical protein
MPRGEDYMRFIIEVDDSDKDFIAATKDVGGSARLRSRGEERNIRVIAQAVPVSVAGRGNRYKACYDVTLVDSL